MGKTKITTENKPETPKEGEVAVAAKATVKKSRRIERGIFYVNASYNNTVVSVSDVNGAIIAWATAGSLGFNGPKKATPFASSKVVATIAEKVKPLGMTTVDVVVKGVGGGRDSALRSIANQGFAINAVRDMTPIPHNGPKPRKVRRV